MNTGLSTAADYAGDRFDYGWPGLQPREGAALRVCRVKASPSFGHDTGCSTRLVCASSVVATGGAALRWVRGSLRWRRRPSAVGWRCHHGGTPLDAADSSGSASRSGGRLRDSQVRRSLSRWRRVLLRGRGSAPRVCLHLPQPRCLIATL